MNNKINFQTKIPRCYDSHVHWMATGELSSYLKLSNFTSMNQLLHKISSEKPNRGEWILGFGWDQSQWNPKLEPTMKPLDEIFPHNPVVLTRCDGHAIWINTKALELVKQNIKEIPKSISGGRIETDSYGTPTGVFVDSAMSLVTSLIPQLSDQELKQNLKKGMHVFNQAGFSHIRDVGGSFSDYIMALELEDSNELTLFCEMYINLDSLENLEARIEEIKKASKFKSKQLKLSGLKLFFDGALGSDGALLSQPYPTGSSGLQIYNLVEIENVFKKCWEAQIAIAIHTLGDEAVHQIVTLAQKMKSKGIVGPLDLEHCEVVRSETILMMKGLDIRCHLQPSHFLSDQKWLKQKLGKLYSDCFPWNSLISHGIPVQFGSDSPIEPPSLELTRRGIEESSLKGILPPPLDSFNRLHSHPDELWGEKCITYINNENEIKLDFKT